MKRCNHPGCQGTLDETGCCDTCLEFPLPTGEVEVSVAAQTAGSARSVVPLEVSSAGLSGAVWGRSGGQASAGPWWGLDLVRVAAAPEPEPERNLLEGASVPEQQRICPVDGSPVGRRHHGQPGLVEAICPKCGTRYSFLPRLSSGDLVAGRYEVVGCIGQGGVGWVYLAHDRNLDGRRVALKGLIDNRDPEIVIQERRFLTSLDHERIVRIHDFAMHPSRDGSPEGYIVMAYVDGRPLSKSVLDLTVPEVIGCALQMLQAFDYLHGQGLLYCDLKPSNAMLSTSGVKLIDVGAVNDGRGGSTGFYTHDYAAPELLVTGPTIVTDLYTVGRTLQDMIQWCKDSRSWDLDSLNRLIGCAVHGPEPLRRFGSAAAMADQLSGVLSEILALQGGRPRPVLSQLFAPTTKLLDEGLGAVPPLGWWTTRAAQTAAAEGSCRRLPVGMPDPAVAVARLPEPYADPADPAAAFLSTVVSSDPHTAIGQLAAYRAPTVEIALRRCRASLAVGEVAEARAALSKALGDLVPGWRSDWIRAWHDGLIALAEGAFEKAGARFDVCCGLLPGETAPKFAQALCEEYRAVSGVEVDPVSLEAARAGYARIWKTDRSYESAVFGLARVYLRQGSRGEAVSVLEDIADTSPYYRAARLAALRVLAGKLTEERGSGLPQAEDLQEAAGRLQADGYDKADRQRLSAGILEAALELLLIEGSDALPTNTDLFGGISGQSDLRERIEQLYRALSDQAISVADRTILVDLANAMRPGTFR